MATHASYPTPLVLSDTLVRVFFSSRDTSNRSSIASIDLEIDGKNWSINTTPNGPLLGPGARGAFDDCGVTVACVVPYDGRILVYYLGWSVSTTVPFRNFIGLATGDAGEGTLQRASVAPVLDRSTVDPYTLGYPWVLRRGRGFRMWYGSHLNWGSTGLEMRHVIKEAASDDGVIWLPSGHVAIPLGALPEFAVSRPCVLVDPDSWRMWYSRRTPAYSLGYAESSDGVTWRRQDDDVVLTGETGAWEDESTAYATIFDHRGGRYMLYNGNGYGRTGFGLAMLER